ncbi:PREDICTED: probable polygalacturonase At3g15720 [Camelina sativa]|uniref:Probable polygalacturonase At3g15720 n=1 Tax=Camelina sativa TaxID=90675 RepID=A0ABM1QIH9_CAMSA|nr:PREDICTED: probable polygalacturonase At3g15720 [Camelina sativa]
MANSVMFLTFLLSLSLFHTFQLVQSRSSLYHDDKNFNVLDYGAIGDGFSDDSKAFKDAWEDTCNYIGSQSTMEIPEGYTFLLQPIEFHGPCKSKKIILSINGYVIAPGSPDEWECKKNHCHQWIEFAHINGLHIDGRGILACLKRPRGVVISHSSNVHISNIMVKDSPNFQMSLEDSKWVSVKQLTITADGDSPNTDGIHIQRSQNVIVHNSNIRTGDDCISIGDGSKYINISRISCGPGHGISIGSLGRYGTKETVEDVVVQDCTFRETTNGVRIKTWQTNAVEIKNVMYNHIHGTSIKKPFVQLLCSKSVPCRGIFMNDINIREENEEEEKVYHKPLSHDHHPSAECINVKGESNGVMKPKLACLESFV